MTYNEAQNASLDQLTDELAAAGWDSTQTTRREALTAVVELIASYNPNSLPEAYHSGFEAAEAGKRMGDCPYADGTFAADAWQFGFEAV